MLRAVGIVRVSQPKGRTGESFSSPKDQREAIESFCDEQGWQLLDVHDELHISGNALLEDRPGLSQAVTAVLTGGADVILGAHSERLWWSHEVRAQVLRLVQDAGGQVWAVDTGQLSGGSAAEDFSGEVRTSADRFSRRQNAEKSRKAVERAVDRGVCPFPAVPPGLELDEDGRPHHAEQASTVRRAFELRDENVTIKEIREFLRENGIERSYHGVTSMLGNRLYLGEIHFGDLSNLEAFDPIVPKDLFNRVQRIKVSRGRRAKSDRLLARLGVLRHDLCGARMNVGTQTQNGRSYAFYRCPTTGDCPERVTIGAEIAEGFVEERVRAHLADEEGRASAAEEARQVIADREKAQADLDAAIRAFAGLEEEDSARERIEELRRVRDEAAEREEQLGGSAAELIVTMKNWDDLLLAGRRALIRATVDTVWVAKEGRGVDRLSIKLLGE